MFPPIFLGNLEPEVGVLLLCPQISAFPAKLVFLLCKMACYKDARRNTGKRLAWPSAHHKLQTPTGTLLCALPYPRLVLSGEDRPQGKACGLVGEKVPSPAPVGVAARR